MLFGPFLSFLMKEPAPSNVGGIFQVHLRLFSPPKSFPPLIIAWNSTASDNRFNNNNDKASGNISFHSYLLIGYTVADVLQVGADVFHIGEAQQNFGKVFFADGGHPLGVGQKFNFQHFCLEVIHKSKKKMQGQTQNMNKWPHLQQKTLSNRLICIYRRCKSTQN